MSCFDLCIGFEMAYPWDVKVVRWIGNKVGSYRVEEC